MPLQASAYPAALTRDAADALLPCARGSGCPLGVDVSALAVAIAAGDHPQAYALARAANPFASSCGGGCHAPCESACRRRNFGAPVAIASLEGYASGFSVPAIATASGPCSSPHDGRAVAALADRGLAEAVDSPRSGHMIAVIGAGAAGLACAHDLALLGHTPVVFDDALEPGGVLTHVIPAFRFPVSAARAECAMILRMSVDYRAGTLIHDASELDALQRDGFSAIFLAIGASAPQINPLAPCSSHPRIHDALRILRDSESLNGRVVVAGEGDLAIDTARALVLHSGGGGRTCAAKVELILSTPYDRTTFNTPLLGAAIADGVTVHAGWSTNRVITLGRADRIVGVEISRASGRVRSIVACDHVVIAPPLIPDPKAFADDFVRNGEGFIDVDPITLRTSRAHVWAGGACAFGHRSIAHATADGKRAAWQIHGAITGASVAVRFASAWIESEPVERGGGVRALTTARELLPLTSAPTVDPFLAHTLPSFDHISREAIRCFDCARVPIVGAGCTSCGECVGACHTAAISLSSGSPSRLLIDLERCTRCGECVEQCPEGAIAMLRAVWEERPALVQLAPRGGGVTPASVPEVPAMAGPAALTTS